MHTTGQSAQVSVKNQQQPSAFIFLKAMQIAFTVNQGKGS